MSPAEQPAEQPAGRPPEEPAFDLGRAIVGSEPIYNAAEVAAETGITLDQARRLWRALGFPEIGTDRGYTQADADAVSLLVQAVDSGLLDFDLAVTLTRALGQTMSRLADWEVGALVHRVAELEAAAGAEAGRDVGDEAGNEAGGDAGDEAEDAARGGAAAGGSSRHGAAARLVADLGEDFEEIIIYAWRRHLAAAVARVEALAASDAGPQTTALTVGFADIVGFTALSNELSRDRIGDLVELFESRCADVVTTQGGRVIKSIGDSVLFVNDDPVRAFDTAEGIIAVVGRDPRMPDVRLGLASGDVVLRLGDVFGPPVNLAARLTAVARRNRIIIDAHLAAQLPEDQFETRRLPARPMRGFGVVEPVAVRRN